MRIQPIDSFRNDVAKPPVLKSRLKRLFDRPFNGVLRISTASAAGGEKDDGSAAAVAEFEPNSVCLDNMVQNFIEENNEKQSFVATAKYTRNRCNCFNGHNDSSDDELDFFSDSISANNSYTDPSDTLKSLTPCATVSERHLLADASKIVEKNNKTCKRKDDLRKIVAVGLINLGYNASVCKSKWEKTSSIPAGDYEYIDVILEGDRLLIDVDFRSEFVIARSTSSYRTILQCLPSIFVGRSDRLLQIVSIASEAARQSLKKKGMYIAPWRKAEYMKSKWLSPHTRITHPKLTNLTPIEEARPESMTEVLECEAGELDLIFGTEEPRSPAMAWQLPAVKPKSSEKGNKMVTGLAALMKEEH